MGFQPMDPSEMEDKSTKGKVEHTEITIRQDSIPNTDINPRPNALANRNNSNAIENLPVLHEIKRPNANDYKNGNAFHIATNRKTGEKIYGWSGDKWKQYAVTHKITIEVLDVTPLYDITKTTFTDGTIEEKQGRIIGCTARARATALGGYSIVEKGSFTIEEVLSTILKGVIKSGKLKDVKFAIGANGHVYFTKLSGINDMDLLKRILSGTAKMPQRAATNAIIRAVKTFFVYKGGNSSGDEADIGWL